MMNTNAQENSENTAEDVTENPAEENQTETQVQDQPQEDTAAAESAPETQPEPQEEVAQAEPEAAQAEEPQPETPAPVKKSSSRSRWYVLHVYSGFENKVAEAIKEKARKKGLDEYVEDIMVPTEEVVEVKRGQRVNTERKFFPGYVLAKLELNDDVWHLIKDTPKVTGFLGGGNKPSPISQKEAEALIQQIQEGVDRPRPSVVYDIGEEVKVIDGPFASFNGIVEDLDEEKAKLKVSVSIFGRATPVELEYSQVEKI